MGETGAYAQRLLETVKFVTDHPYGVTGEELSVHLCVSRNTALTHLRALRKAGWVETDLFTEGERGEAGQLKGSRFQRYLWRLRSDWVLKVFDKQRLMLEIARPEEEDAA